jgi:CBS domain-containing protein
MANFVREIMNRELFTVTADARSADVLETLLEYGITAAPVVDDHQQPIGVTSLRDVLCNVHGHGHGNGYGSTSQSHISSPAITIGIDAKVEDAARVMAEHNLHHLIAVGANGRVAGMVSSLDLVRALVGFPIQHPPTFPHRDTELGLVISWSDPLPLTMEHFSTVPSTAGVLVLSQGGAKQVEHDVWAEDCNVLRTRLVDLLETPQEAPGLARLLGSSWAASAKPSLTMTNLRFRFTEISDPRERASVARRIRARIDAMPLPFGHTLVGEGSKDGR